MGRLNNDEQFKFLISCIRWSNNGKVDFTEVAKECNIVSKGAAAKRYERMMKAHGIHQPTSTARDTAVPPMRSKEQNSFKDPGAKKRKIDEFDSSNVGPTKKEAGPKSIKDESIGTRAAPTNAAIKNELPLEQDYPWLAYRASSSASTMDDAAFNEFIATNAFEPINATGRALSERLGKGLGLVQEEGQTDRTGRSRIVID